MGKVTRPPASVGAFSPDAVLLLTLLRRFSTAQQEALKGLLDGLWRPNQLRDELFRQICLSAAKGEPKHLADLQRDLRAFGSKPTVAEALGVLEQAGLVVADEDPQRRQSKLIRPTDLASEFYNRSESEVIREEREALLP